MKVPRARWSGVAALVLAFGLGGCSGPALSITSAGSTSTTGGGQSSTSSAGTSSASSASSSTGVVPVECPEGEVYRCLLDGEGKCGPDSGCRPAVEYCDPQVCTVGESSWSADCDFACGIGWDCTPSTDPALLLCQAEIPGVCQEGEVYRCRLDGEGECGPGSGCVRENDSCDPLACTGKNSDSGWCESVCGFGWDCSPSDDPSIANCIADPADEGCDPWDQDCPEGYKCAAWADDGGNSWNATRCVPVVPEPKQVGESCSFPGSVLAGDDDCDLGLMCWNVDYETKIGTCMAFCGGSPDEPTCAEGSICLYALRGVGVALCMEFCDPLAQDCPGATDLCLPSGDEWICYLDASGDAGQFGDPCEYLTACDPGLMCVGAEIVPGCMASGCCSPFCDISAPNTCPGVGQVCLPWYEEGTAPRGYENVGVCGLPP
ncbi:MAG: hypothetical protein H6711_03765 [Myxococcales bacterium]|nr:hypothetical protein [Myxococcales bacterium]